MPSFKCVIIEYDLVGGGKKVVDQDCVGPNEVEINIVGTCGRTSII